MVVLLHVHVHVQCTYVMIYGFSLGFSLVCVLYSLYNFWFHYAAERLGGAVGQISPAAAQTTAEWANRPGIIGYRLITTLYMYVLIIIILMRGIP